MQPYRNFLILFLALTTLGGSALAWKEYQELVKLRARLGSEDAAGLQKRLTDAQKRLKAAQDEIAALRSRSWRGATAGMIDEPGSGPSSPADRRPGPGAQAGGFLGMLNNPQAQQLMAIQMKGMLDARYAALFKSLNLTPQQVDQFKNLMVQKQQAMMDAVAAAREQGIDPRTDPAGFKQALVEAQASTNDQIKTALGDAGYAQYQQYEQTLPQRNTVNQLQQSLSYTPTPLTDDQANQLVQVLAQNSPAGTGGGNLFASLRAGPGGLNQTGPVTAAALTQAQGVLSAPQIQALQQIQQQQAAQAQMQQMLRASFGPNAAPAAAAGTATGGVATAVPGK